MMKAVLAATLCAGWALHGIGPAQSQAYPNKPIKIVVPFPPGGSVDVQARIISDRLGAVLGQSVVIENHGGGAGGSNGAKFVAAADPDGYTVLITPGGALTSGPAVYKNIGYDPAKVFAPVALLLETPQVISVHPDLPVKSLAEVVAYAKTNPGKIAGDHKVSAPRRTSSSNCSSSKPGLTSCMCPIAERHRCSRRPWPGKSRWSATR